MPLILNLYTGVGAKAHMAAATCPPANRKLLDRTVTIQNSWNYLLYTWLLPQVGCGLFNLHHQSCMKSVREQGQWFNDLVLNTPQKSSCSIVFI